jgi:hypothetical protein
MSASRETFETFEQFWPYYLGEHRDPLNRALHYVGTSLMLGTVATAAITANPTWLLLAPVVGYGPAWFGHFVIEHNKPATFKHPVWSLMGDFKMIGMAVTGKLDAELERLFPASSASSPAGAERATLEKAAVNGAAAHAAS